MLTLAALHGHELGTAVCFGWDVLGNLEGMEKEEDLPAQFTYIMVRVGIFAVGIMTCILTPPQCSLVLIFPLSFKEKKTKLRVTFHRGWKDLEPLNSSRSDTIPRNTDHFITIIHLL